MTGVISAHESTGGGSGGTTSLDTFVLVALSGVYGVTFVNVLPVFISAWVKHLNITHQIAGAIATANLLAYTVGMLGTLSLVGRWPLARIACIGLAIGVMGEAASANAGTAMELAAARILAGLGTGFQVGAVINWISRDRNAARGFGTFALLQIGLTSTLLFLVPRLDPSFGRYAVYCALIPLVIIAAALVGVIKGRDGSLAQDLDSSADEKKRARRPTEWIRLDGALLILGFAAFEVAAVGLYGYMVAFGELSGLTSESASRSLGMASVAGILGSALVIQVGNRFGRRRPLSISLLGFASAILMFIVVESSPVVFIAGQVVIGFMWSMVHPYFQGLQSALDVSGRLTLMGMIVVRLATAMAPGLIGIVVGHGSASGFQAAFMIALAACLFSLLVVIWSMRVPMPIEA